MVGLEPPQDRRQGVHEYGRARADTDSAEPSAVEPTHLHLCACIVFQKLSRDTARRAEMVVNLVSFGYKYGVPLDADLIFDVRCLPNPHFVDRLRHMTGRDRPVVQYMRRHASTREFIDRLTSFLQFALPQYVQEGKSYLTIGIGCTGGQHRSVMIAEALRKSLAPVKNVRLRVKHRDG